MAAPDLRPMSVGEILDRTASLYRNNFILFFGISFLSHILVLAWVLTQLAIQGPPPGIESRGLRDLAILTGTFVEYMFAYLFAQGPTAFAVSELYFGRRTSARASFVEVIRRFGRLTRGVLLSGFSLFAGAVLLVLPGLFFACRLLVALPAAVLEDLGARESFKRSFSLTRHHTGRAFAVYALYVVLRIAALLLILYPTHLVTEFSRVNPLAAIPWRNAVAFVTVSFATLIDPFLTIAATVFYFDLRVRKEALDLQLMMGAGESIPAGPIGAS